MFKWLQVFKFVNSTPNKILKWKRVKTGLLPLQRFYKTRKSIKTNKSRQWVQLLMKESLHQNNHKVWKIHQIIWNQQRKIIIKKILVVFKMKNQRKNLTSWTCDKEWENQIIFLPDLALIFLMQLLM